MKKIKDNKTPKELRDIANNMKLMTGFMSMLSKTGIFKDEESMKKLRVVPELIDFVRRRA